MFLGVPSALIGTLIGKKYIQKMNHQYLSVVVGAALLLMGVLLFFGLI
jgi:uncharacterized membrane protein YfcA